MLFGLSMAIERLTEKLAVILHADVVGSTQLVQRDEHLAHKRIQESFRRFADIIEQYGGGILELRGDALIAEFERASDAVSATLAFQADQATYLSHLEDELKPGIRAGIAMGEVVMGNNTVTGAGVVLSQRVEQLADPGGLCITAALHETLPHRLPFDLEDTGEQTLKGFHDPVRVYRVKLNSGATIPPPRQRKQSRYSKFSWRIKAVVAVVVAAVFVLSANLLINRPPKTEMPSPEKPSIAVLPFTNMSGDTEHEYFVDGMTNDLTTDISMVPGLFVIARNTMDAYKGEVVNIGEVAEELGVRYVMAGSVERAGNRVRIHAQLIDSTTGGQVWAERHDGTLDDVFSMRDEMTRKIVTSLSVALVGRRMVATSIPEAYDAFLRAWDLYRLRTPEAYAKAIPYLENAIELDPDFARAHAMLAMIYSGIYTLGWAERSGVSYDDALRKFNLHVGEAMKNPTPLAHRAAAQMHEYFGRLDKAMIAAQSAIDLDPNDPQGYDAMSSLLVDMDRASESLELVKKAMRLDPQSDYLYSLGSAQFHLGRYDEAADTFLRATKRNPGYEWNYLLLAASYGNLGREQEAMSVIATFNNMYHDPADKQRPMTLVDLTELHKSEAGLKRLREGLRKTGMPEGVAGKPANLKFMDLVTVSAGTFDVEGAIAIDAAEAKTMHDRGIAFIDSRGKGHYESGHIPGATHLLFHQVWDSLVETVSKDAEVVFYCGGPDCHLAAHSSAQAITLGYTRVYYFAGGFSAWENAGYPVEGS
jgi:TolB-like protein/class 3 adenylate cyclase/rhodanese-related sulfurtransferase/Tfp pilus assembly protein PilF